jgi:membrane-associated phospholipid phosphatase
MSKRLTSPKFPCGPTLRSTTEQPISTQKKPDDSVTLDKSDFTFRGLVTDIQASVALVAKLCSVYAMLKIRYHFGVDSMFRSITLLAACIAMSASPAFAKGEKTWATISDIGAYGLATVAIGLPIVEKDKHGAFQAAGSIAATSLITKGMKEAFPELRPDGSDRKSFPSGHTAMAFTAAASLYNRQGQSVGIPALAVATLVGVARVKADKHFWYDAVVGAGIGAGVGFLITHKKPERETAFIPWGDTKGGGFTFVTRF